MPDAPLSLQCPKCRYSLVGITEPRCPECGQELFVSTPGAERAIGIAACRIFAIWLLCNGVTLLAIAAATIVVALVDPYGRDERALRYLVILINPAIQIAGGIVLWMFAHRIACSISLGHSIPRPDRWNVKHIELLQVGMQIVGVWVVATHVPDFAYVMLTLWNEPNSSNQVASILYHIFFIAIGLVLLLRVGWIMNWLVRFAKAKQGATVAAPLTHQNKPPEEQSPPSLPPTT